MSNLNTSHLLNASLLTNHHGLVPTKIDHTPQSTLDHNPNSFNGSHLGFQGSQWIKTQNYNSEQNDLLLRVEKSVNRYKEFAMRSDNKPPEQLMMFEHGQLFNDHSPNASIVLDNKSNNLGPVSLASSKVPTSNYQTRSLEEIPETLSNQYDNKPETYNCLAIR